MRDSPSTPFQEWMGFDDNNKETWLEMKKSALNFCEGIGHLVRNQLDQKHFQVVIADMIVQRKDNGTDMDRERGEIGGTPKLVSAECFPAFAESQVAPELSSFLKTLTTQIFTVFVRPYIRSVPGEEVRHESGRTGQGFWECARRAVPADETRVFAEPEEMYTNSAWFKLCSPRKAEGAGVYHHPARSADGKWLGLEAPKALNRISFTLARYESFKERKTTTAGCLYD